MISLDAKTRAWVKAKEDIEAEALEQIAQVSKLPFVEKVAVMPDVHAGKGATIGTVIQSTTALIPSAVGVDIGCGMMALKTTLLAKDLPDSLARLRLDIEATIPVGFDMHTNTDNVCTDPDPHDQLDYLDRKYKANFDRQRYLLQLGTLGGGNHFIEICLDEYDSVWFMLHSGSRGIGNKIGSLFIAEAKKQVAALGVKADDLAPLHKDTEIYDDYVNAVSWAQGYAAENRRVMMHLLIGVCKKHLPAFGFDEYPINCHHNYIEFNGNKTITRKGAVSAKKGEYGIIPGSMGTKSYIVRGLGNEDALHSCSHGAGRVMSRTRARKEITLAQHEAALVGVECRKDEGILDESPAAYKDIDEVMSNQSDLVEIIATLKAVLCVKG